MYSYHVDAFYGVENAVKLVDIERVNDNVHNVVTHFSSLSILSLSLSGGKWWGGGEGGKGGKGGRGGGKVEGYCVTVNYL